MITTYNARVKFPMADKPYDAGHGPSFNVGVEILDGNNNPDIFAPKTKDGGLVNIYRPEDAQEIPYMKSLSYADEIQLQYVTQGKKGRYDFVIPSTWEETIPNKIVSSITNEFVPLTDGEVAALKTSIDEDTMLTIYAFERLATWMKTTDYPLSFDAMLRTANGHRISARTRHKRGQEAIITNDDVTLVKSRMFGDALDDDDLTVTALQAIVKFAPIDYALDMLKQDMNGIGVRHVDFETRESCLRVAETIWEMLEIINNGMDREVAISSTRDAYAKGN